METELQDKHAKRKMKTTIRKLVVELKKTVNEIIFNAITYQLNIAIKSRTKAKKTAS